MPQVLWSQDIFSKGEISPLMYARVSVAPYYNGLKTAENVITFPQGAAGKRFGTIYQNTITGVTDAFEIYFQSMQYLNECVYLIVLTPNILSVYLEGVLIQTVSSTPIGANEIILLDYTVLDDTFRLTAGVIPPQDVTRSPDTPVTITNFDFDTNIITVSSSYYTTGLILPVRFSFGAGGGNSLFTSNPQVLSNKTYFLYFLSPTTAQIYYTAPQAKLQLDPFTLLTAGVGTQYATTLNTWAMNQTPIAVYPTYDFGAVNYTGTTFTPAATSGYGVTITLSGSPSTFLTSEWIGGTFQGNSGLARIIAIPTSSTMTVNILVSFSSTSGIPGTLSVLTEPAWSTIRGWPRICSSFQNRAFFANTDLLPNGLWGSTINDFLNFDDSETFATNAISWYPTSGDINYIRFIVPYRSLTVHTNSGVMSTPLSVETAITPLNFSLTLQDSTPAEFVQPRGIDNQIIILSGNDAHSLLWDGFNNAYSSNIISIANEQVIRNPISEAAFVDLTRAGSRYMLIINGDGSLAIYQTLISEEVQGFTPARLYQSYGNAYFRWVATSFDGRGWFVTEREIATEGAPSPIDVYTQYTLGTGIQFSLLNTTPFAFLNGNNFYLLQNDFVFAPGITAFQFQTTGSLPTSTPQVQLDTWYWAVPTDNLDFMVYLTIEDAEASINPVMFFNAGVNTTVTPWALAQNFFIEELSFEYKVDCAFQYNSGPTSTFPNLPQFNAQEVQIQGDGFGFDYLGIDSTVETIAHGMSVDVTSAQIGFPIPVTIEPLPLSIYQGSTKQSNLQVPKHIRAVNFMFADTIGGEVNGIPISMLTFNEVPIGEPPFPVNGIFEYSPMAAWDDFKSIGLTVTHSAPFDIKLIGVFYKVDI